MRLCIVSGCTRERAAGIEYCYVHGHHADVNQSTPPPATDWAAYSVLDAATDISDSFSDSSSSGSDTSAPSNDFSFDGGDSGGGGAGGDF